MTTAIAHVIDMDEDGDLTTLCGAPAEDAAVDPGSVTEHRLCQECLNLALDLEGDK